MDAMNTEHVVVDNKGEIVYHDETAIGAFNWAEVNLADDRYTIELMDKPSEPKTTPEQADFAVGDLVVVINPRATKNIFEVESLTHEGVLVMKWTTVLIMRQFFTFDLIRLATPAEKATGHRIDAPTICIEEETPELFESKHCSPRPLSDHELKPRQAHEIAEAALQHVKDRASTYDQSNGERSARKTAAAFNAITGKDLTESDVWLLLQLLKDVRQWSKEDYHQDSAEDCIAYAALKAESLEREHKHNP